MDRVGIAWDRGKRITGIMHGITTSEITARDGIPGFLTRTRLRDINELDEYLGELQRRLDDD